ncbi:hypothetical protein TEA_014644 [Camellia sinensis var. sinensis]|uniref:Uncharacterized protein n=1 Tax=Camellia sinensis var. sinensis TaxID=542762 RepID=A0A4S4D6X6_CAMSN|nr:hypothetical protein TEA_014644 [Camellia sinensis var. sinensis]
MAIEEVTPSVYPSGALFPYEERTLELLGKEHFSVVNVFDVILHHQLNIMGVVEVPEGNEGVHNFKGKLICADSAEDLAVLKVEDTDDLLRPINVGQSSSLRVPGNTIAAKAGILPITRGFNGNILLVDIFVQLTTDLLKGQYSTVQLEDRVLRPLITSSPYDPHQTQRRQEPSLLPNRDVTYGVTRVKEENPSN